MKKELKEQLFEDMIKAALQDELEEETSEIMTEEEMRAAGIEVPTFSREFERKMERMIRRRRREEWMQTNKKMLRNLAAVFLLVCLAGGTVISTVDAVRIPIKNFFLEIGGMFVQADDYIESARSETEEIIPEVGLKAEEVVISEEYAEFMPTYVLEGYNLTYVIKEANNLMLEYSHPDGSFYMLQFCPEIPSNYVDGENANVETIEINGMQATIVKEENMIRVVYQNNNSQYILQGSMSQTEAIKILESIP